jgi:hypothetical protein
VAVVHVIAETPILGLRWHETAELERTPLVDAAIESGRLTVVGEQVPRPARPRPRWTPPSKPPVCRPQARSRTSAPGSRPTRQAPTHPSHPRRANRSSARHPPRGSRHRRAPRRPHRPDRACHTVCAPADRRHPEPGRPLCPRKNRAPAKLDHRRRPHRRRPRHRHSRLRRGVQPLDSRGDGAAHHPAQDPRPLGRQEWSPGAGGRGSRLGWENGGQRPHPFCLFRPPSRDQGAPVPAAGDGGTTSPENRPAQRGVGGHLLSR